MDADTSKRFYMTLWELTDGCNDRNPSGNGLDYARYRAVEFLKPDYRSKYKNAVHIGQTLAGIYRVHMVKRLESSFHAFKKSLRSLLRITEDMIKMFDENKVIIAPDLKVKDLQAKNMELDEIIEYAVTKGYAAEDIVFKADAFEPQRGFSRVAAGFSSYDGEFRMPLVLAQGSPIFHSSCEGKLGIALE